MESVHRHAGKKDVTISLGETRDAKVPLPFLSYVFRKIVRWGDGVVLECDRISYGCWYLIWIEPAMWKDKQPNKQPNKVNEAKKRKMTHKFKTRLYIHLPKTVGYDRHTLS